MKKDSLPCKFKFIFWAILTVPHSVWLLLSHANFAIDGQFIIVHHVSLYVYPGHFENCITDAGKLAAFCDAIRVVLNAGNKISRGFARYCNCFTSDKLLF